MEAPDYILDIVLNAMPDPRPADAASRARRAADRMWTILGNVALTPEEQDAQIIEAICSEALSYLE